MCIHEMLFAELIFVVALGQRWRSRDPEQLFIQRSPALAISLVALFREPENNKKATTTVFVTFDPSRYPRPGHSFKQIFGAWRNLKFSRSAEGLRALRKEKVHLQNFK